MKWIETEVRQTKSLVWAERFELKHFPDMNSSFTHQYPKGDLVAGTGKLFVLCVNKRSRKWMCLLRRREDAWAWEPAHLFSIPSSAQFLIAVDPDSNSVLIIYWLWLESFSLWAAPSHQLLCCCCSSFEQKSAPAPHTRLAHLINRSSWQPSHPFHLFFASFLTHNVN